MMRKRRYRSNRFSRLLPCATLALMLIALVMTSVTGAEPQPNDSGAELPSLDSIRAGLEQRYTNLRDVRASLLVREFDPLTRNVRQFAAFRIDAIPPGLVRLTYTQPDVMSGLVTLVDYSRSQVYLYNPVMEMSECHTLNDFASSLGMPAASVDTLFVIPSDDAYDIEVTHLEQVNGSTYAVVHARSVAPLGADFAHTGLEDLLDAQLDMDEPHSLKVWVDVERSIVHRVQLFDQEGRLLYEAEATSIQFDLGMRENQVRSLPGSVGRRCL